MSLAKRQQRADLHDGRRPLALRFAAVFFNDPAATEIYTLSLHDALPISPAAATANSCPNPSSVRYGTRWTLTRSEEHTSELQSHSDLVCRLLLEKKNRLSAACILTHLTSYEASR